MRTDYIVTGMIGSAKERPHTMERFAATFAEAQEIATGINEDFGYGVTIIWARQGRNMWPVRIYYPATEHLPGSTPPCVPISGRSTIFAVSTFQPSGFPIVTPPLSR